MRINSKAHAGFCRSCGPCSCDGSRRNTATLKKEIGRVRVDCWWTKPNDFMTHWKKDANKKERTENDVIQEETEEIERK